MNAINLEIKKKKEKKKKAFPYSPGNKSGY